MKKLVKFTLLSVFLCLFINRVDALSVSKNDLTIEKGGGDRVELYANSDTEITKVEFTLTFTTYDVPANFIVNNGYTDGNPNGIKHSVSFGEAKNGKILLGTVDITVKSYPEGNGGTINISGAKGYTSNGDVVSLNSQNIEVKIGTPDNNQKEEKKEEEKKEEKKEIDKNLLDKIESKIVKIELKKDVFEYKVIIDKDVKELDLKAIPKDENTKVEISNQLISELKDNKITITATNGDVKQEYIINLSTKKDIEVTVDKTEFKESGSYKGKWIVAAIALIVLLMIGLVLTKKK